ncbi:MAG TPA: ATP-dependent helicase, partial [Phaeodactylibacter sp.]|nr:ATP-dependent helicase [Phaeodactylibacter sp.]
MKSRKEQLKGFRQMLNGLNDAQRQAVDQIEGPVLVLAGPGTGKTHMLTARIGQILLQTDTNPENILCLTFTDAAALTMRKRLLKLIGPVAHRIHIHTFHAFAYGILRDYPQYFDFKDWQLITELERIEIIHQLLDELPADNHLKKQYADPYTLTGLLGKLFINIKEEDWNTDYLLQQTRAYTDSLLQRPEFYYKRKSGKYKKGDLKVELYEKELGRMQLFSEAVKQYDSYTSKLRQHSLIEYADMILLVLNAFKKHPDLLLLQQEKYLYFLVDEYQDTNSAQNQLLLQLINYWDVPNVLIVGDDDQSIYEFQGARLKNLIDFYKRYQNHLSVSVLTHNYRSTPAILRAAGKLIEHNSIRLIKKAPELSLDKTLLAAREDLPDKEIPVQVLSFPTELHEETWLTQQLKTLKEQKFPLEHCALIYARHRQSERLQSLLAKAGIPFQTRKQSNALDHPLIRIWRKLLDWLQAETKHPHKGEHLLYNILQAPFWGLSPNALTRTALARIEQATEEPQAWRALISSEKNLAKAGLNEEEIAAFRQIHQCLEDCLTALHELPLPLLIEKTL